jgi:AcrR family transcriptional regulator
LLSHRPRAGELACLKKTNERSISYRLALDLATEYGSAVADQATIPKSGKLAASQPCAEPFAMEAICARILDRHRDLIGVQKPHLATANLARIFEAVLDLSSRQGFHETTMRDVAKAAGLSMGGLYAYVDNKNTLLVMILTEVAETVVNVLNDVPACIEAKPDQHLRWLIATHIRLTEAMLPWFVFAFMEAKGFPAPARKLATESERATERIFATVLKRGAASGVFVIEDLELTASLIKPLLQDWYVKRAKYRRRAVSVQSYISGVTNFIENAIHSRESLFF